MMHTSGGRGGGRGGAGKPPSVADGDWACPNPGCTNVNFARRAECNRCHTQRPDGVGGADGTKSNGSDVRGPPGLFKAGDWSCAVCGNVNWERRSECNICKSPKPGMPGLDEKRDGAGGGFNERQERAASAKTEVDEDGYDDFGMKKKKVKASKAEREAAALARLKQSYSAIIVEDTPSSNSTRSPPPKATKSDTGGTPKALQQRDRAQISRSRSRDRQRSRSRDRYRNQSPHRRDDSRRFDRGRDRDRSRDRTSRGDRRH